MTTGYVFHITNRWTTRTFPRNMFRNVRYRSIAYHAPHRKIALNSSPIYKYTTGICLGVMGSAAELAPALRLWTHKPRELNADRQSKNPCLPGITIRKRRRTSRTPAFCWRVVAPDSRGEMRRRVGSAPADRVAARYRD